MTIYQRIRDLREDKDISQANLAKHFFLHATQYRRYEKGDSEPPFDFILRLAEFYDVSIDYIAGRTNDKNSHKKSKNINTKTIVKQLQNIIEELEN